MPRVSIIISTYNRAQLIGKAIASVFQQTYTDWELFVVDDASTDATAEVVGRWRAKDARIAYLPSRENIGIARNSNRGLRAAQGEYVAILDDDDYWIDPEKLRKQIDFLDTHPEYVGVGGGVVMVDAEGKTLFHYIKPETDERIRRRILFDNPIANSTTLFRRATAEAVGYYDESLRYAGDRDFWLKMGLAGKLYNIPEYFSAYLFAGQNTSVTRMREHLRSSLMIMRRYRGRYPGYAPALAMNYVQYWYSFLPTALKRFLHLFLARLKRLLFR